MKILKNIKNISTIYKYIFAYILFFSAVVCMKHYTFHSNAWDLSIFDEAIWNTTQGRFMLTQVKGINYFSDHFSPILLLFVPFYYLGAGSLLLIISQVVIVTLGALPIYWMAKDYIQDERFHYLFPLAYLCFLPLWSILLFDFHPESISITLFLFAFYYLTKDRFILATILIILGAMCKENMILVMGFFGLYIIFAKNKRIWGSILAIIGIFMFFYTIQHIIPSFGESKGFMYFNRYGYLGTNLFEMVSTIFTKPFFVLKYVLIPDKIIYVCLMTASVSFLCYFAPLSFMLSIPIFAQNLLTTYSGQYGFYSQYNAGIIEFLFISAILGLNNVQKIRSQKIRSIITKCSYRIICLFMIFFIVIFFLEYFLRYTVITQHCRVGYKLLKRIPESASLVASSHVHPHLTHRKEMWEFPKGVGKAQYIIVETSDPNWPMEEKDCPIILKKLWNQKNIKKLLVFIFLSEERDAARRKVEDQKEVDSLLKDKRYEILYNSDQFLLAKKK